jgi:hypothetical protein
MAEYESRQRWDLGKHTGAQHEQRTGRPAEADRPHRKRDLAARS